MASLPCLEATWPGRADNNHGEILIHGLKNNELCRLSSPSPGLLVVFWFHLVPVSRIIKKPAIPGGLFLGILSA